MTPDDAAEALLNAQAINKILRSRASDRHPGGEKLHVNEDFNCTGTLI